MGNLIAAVVLAEETQARRDGVYGPPARCDECGRILEGPGFGICEVCQQADNIRTRGELYATLTRARNPRQRRLCV